MASRSESVDEPKATSTWISYLLSPRARTWLLTVPLHLMAFVVLYVASAKIMEAELLSLASEAAGDRLEQVVREIDKVAMAPGRTSDSGHLLQALIRSQREVNLQLFLTPAKFIGPRLEVPLELHAVIGNFFEGQAAEEVWLSSEGGVERLRGLRRVEAKQECAPCHQQGQTVAVVAMSLDITRIVGRVRSRSRRNLGLLILAWAVLLGGVNILVKRSVDRFGERLAAQLAAAEAGEPAAVESPELVLHPASAQLYRALREFLERQRRRQAEVAARLEHSDQLASLGQLAAGLAHEIKNPLAGIQGALEILREDSSEQENVQLYDDMLGELERVNTTLRLLLESARPSPPNLALIDPEPLIKETVYLLRPGLKRRDISLVYDFSPGTKETWMDGAKIRQVLINLIQNAAEAMENGGNIVVRLGSFPDTGDGLILAVEDDGPGIPEGVQGKICEPFFTTKFSGTGLGLAITKGLVEQHGGTLELDSTPGRGTTFYVLLPSPPDELSKAAGRADPGGRDVESNPTPEE